MKRFLMAAMMAGIMPFLLTSFAHAQAKGDEFTGIWQVVDNGTLVTLDISDIDGDGQFRYSVNFDYGSACNGPGELGRQLVTPLTPATINADGDLVLNVTVTCPLTKRVVEESTALTFRLIGENILLNVVRGAPFHRISAL